MTSTTSAWLVSPRVGGGAMAARPRARTCASADPRRVTPLLPANKPPASWILPALPPRHALLRRSSVSAPTEIGGRGRVESVVATQVAGNASESATSNDGFPSLKADIMKEMPDTEQESGGGGMMLLVGVGALLALLVGALCRVSYLDTRWKRRCVHGAQVGGGAYYREGLMVALDTFGTHLEGMGTPGMVLFAVVYVLLELVAVPVLPLTLSAGAIFGTGYGVVLASVAGTTAACLAFLISRYVARDRVLAMAKDNRTFRAIDSAIGKEGFKVVLLLRLSPLMPFALGNYLYGLTSVQFSSYALGSWLGMLPGTLAIVAAGTVGKAALAAEGLGGGTPWWQVAVGLGTSVGVSTYITRLAQKELDSMEALEGVEAMVDIVVPQEEEERAAREEARK